ncbi:PPC domain-containing protein [Brevundimonas sp.]|uniref:PPC domain-containing protein n=1 Tax=Brevundimonas sp. TaxID=1871086 RepID=UPI00286CD212|nr:PPC domain-containing protein [Brevundimonas sp.]
MRRSAFIMTVSALALFAAGHAAAQDATQLRIGQTVSGQLTAEDTQVDSEDFGQFVYDTWSVQARDGQRLQVVMRSDDFDAYLEVYKSTDTGEAIVMDDDGLGEGTNSRARFTAESGAYIIRARTLGGLEGGDYTIEVTDRGQAPRAPRPTAIRLGDDVDGEISDRSAVEEDGEYGEYTYNGYSFRAREGERFAITLESDDFDPMVRVGRMARGGGFEELARNDDSGAGGLNSYLIFTAPSNGEYVIRAAPLDGTAEGDYELGLAEGPPPLVARPIAIGDTVEASLDAGDGGNDSGQRADAYSFTGTAGQRIVVTMSSDAFDTYLELFADNADVEGGRYALDSDDDGAGEGTNSRLTYSLTADGQYVIEARAFTGEGEGAYTLSFEEAAPLPAPVALTFGATVQGEIVAEDPRDDEGRGFDAYTLSGTAGNRIQLIMRSGDFDTYLQIGSPEGDFYVMASDDDGLGEGTDSRLNYIVPNDGEFIVRASPLSADADGLYSLELLDRGPQPLPGSILVGATARGTLGEDDALAEDGSFYDAYKITVKVGDKLRLTMVSNEFDAFIDIGREDEAGVFTSVVSDDDSLSDTHAKVDWAVEEEGDYIIRARSFSSGQSGAYALTVEPKE